MDNGDKCALCESFDHTGTFAEQKLQFNTRSILCIIPTITVHRRHLLARPLNIPRPQRRTPRIPSPGQPLRIPRFPIRPLRFRRPACPLIDDIGLIDSLPLIPLCRNSQNPSLDRSASSLLTELRITIRRAPAHPHHPRIRLLIPHDLRAAGGSGSTAFLVFGEVGIVAAGDLADVGGSGGDVALEIVVGGFVGVVGGAFARCGHGGGFVV